MCFPVGNALVTAKATAHYEEVIERIISLAHETNRASIERQLLISEFEIAILRVPCPKNFQAEGLAAVICVKSRLICV
jgi:hypothetical protein